MKWLVTAGWVSMGATVGLVLGVILSMIAQVVYESFFLDVSSGGGSHPGPALIALLLLIPISAIAGGYQGYRLDQKLRADQATQE